MQVIVFILTLIYIKQKLGQTQLSIGRSFSVKLENASIHECYER